MASIEYRLSHQAIFPAQTKDCKAVVRWLKANAEYYRIDPYRFGAWGSSAGGHLVALLGTSGWVDSWEVGDNLHQTSCVQAVCDWFGPTDFLRMNDVPGEIDHDAFNSPESQLIGGLIQENSSQGKSNYLCFYGCAPILDYAWQARFNSDQKPERIATSSLAGKRKLLEINFS